MVDISKQITYWQDGAKEDFEVARQLINSDRIRHGLFFAHLAIEKLLKAKFCQTTSKIAPRIHNLVRLAEMSDITTPGPILDILAEMNEFNLEGRYPVPFISPVSKPEAENYIKKTEEVITWLNKQL
jgi:HEPN domain-containing protein